MAKCQFGRHELDFLGHHITKHGATLLPSKVTPSENSQAFNSQRTPGVCRHGEFLSPFCARSSQHYATPVQGKLKVLQWNDQMISALNLTKEALASATMLAHPRADAPTAITVDASGVAVGAILEQLIHGSWQPLAFFSRLLRKSTVKDGTSQILNHSYSPSPKYQILGLLDSVTSLQYPNTQPASSTSQERAMKWLMHCLAVINAVHQNLMEPGIDFTAMATAQQNDQEINGSIISHSNIRTHSPRCPVWSN